MLLHKDKFVTKWIAGIKLRLTGMCEDGFVVPMIALFYNNAATDDILESKRRERLQLAAIEQQSQRVPWYFARERLMLCLKSWRERIAVHVWVWRHQPSAEAMDRCLSSPEFVLLKYLHKLTERMAAWHIFLVKNSPSNELPKEFVDLKGPSDAPHTVYERLHRIQEAMDAFVPAEMQRTMLVVMLSNLMRQPEKLNPAHAE